MVDRWGRIGAEDFNAATNMINNIQIMGDRADARQSKRDLNTNYGALMDPAKQIPQSETGGPEYQVPADPGAMAPPELVGDAAARVGALEMVAKTKQFEKITADMEREKNRRELTDIFMSSGLSLPADQKGKWKPSDVAIAQADAAKLFRESDEGKQAFQEQRAKSSMSEYQDFMRTGELIKKSLLSGDKDSAAHMISGMTQKLSMPYKYEYDKESDSFKEFYSHSGSGQFEPTGSSLKFTEVMEKINGMTPQEFAKASYMFKQATTEWNEEARKPVGMEGGKGQYMKKGGKEFYVFPQKTVNSTDIPHYIVMDQDNNETTFTSIQALQNAGFRYEDLKRTKALTDISLDEERIKTEKLQQNKISAESKGAMAEGGKKALEIQGKLLGNDKKSLDMMLTPFHNGQAAMFTPDGEDFSEAGKAALQKAMEFVEKYSVDEGKLSQTDKMKLDKGRQAIQIWDGVTKRISKGYGVSDPNDSRKPEAQSKGQPYAGDAPPPISGAKRGKDGIWVVQQNGKLFPVMQDGEPTTQQDQAPISQEGSDMDMADPGKSEKPAQKPEEFKPIGQLGKKKIGRTSKGYAIQDEDGNVRQPTDEEMSQIQLMARKGLLSGSALWTPGPYENKYPADPTAGRGRGQILTPNLSGRM